MRPLALSHLSQLALARNQAFLRGIRVYVRGETRRYARFLPYLPPQKLGIVSHVDGNACFQGVKRVLGGG